MTRLCFIAAVFFLTGVPGAYAQAGAAAVYVVAHVDVPPNFTKETAALLEQFAAASRGDAGAVRVEVLQETARPNHFTLVEVWRSRKLFEAHAEAPHTRSFREKLHPMLGSPFDERLNVVIK